MFTFKKHPRKGGLYSDVDIKLKKKKIGYISAASWNKRYWTIHFQIKGSHDNPNCSWHWEVVNHNFPDEKHARYFLRENFNKYSNLDFYIDEENNV